MVPELQFLHIHAEYCNFYEFHYTQFYTEAVGERLQWTIND